MDDGYSWGNGDEVIDELQFLTRFVRRMVYRHLSFFLTCANASYEMWEDEKEGLQDESPEDMCDNEMDCWD